MVNLQGWGKCQCGAIDTRCQRRGQQQVGEDEKRQ